MGNGECEQPAIDHSPFTMDDSRFYFLALTFQKVLAPGLLPAL
jgi:hypothetical protein